MSKLDETKQDIIKHLEKKYGCEIEFSPRAEKQLEKEIKRKIRVYRKYCKICKRFTKFKTEPVRRVSKKERLTTLLKCSKCRQYLTGM